MIVYIHVGAYRVGERSSVYMWVHIGWGGGGGGEVGEGDSVLAAYIYVQLYIHVRVPCCARTCRVLTN